MVRIRLTLGYDGTDYFGWAKQPGLRTVQGVLETSLQDLLSNAGHATPASVTVAGRTDSGVHARVQTVHLDLADELWQRRGNLRLVGQLNANLPNDVRVLSATAVPGDFDARFSALYRTYTYRVHDQTQYLHPLESRISVAHGVRLDVTRMAEASHVLLGEHDFAAFCRYREGASTVRTLRECDVVRLSEHEIKFTVVADAFCHSMVRSLVGALVAVGEGKESSEWLTGLLARTTRSDAVRVMPAAGLVLESIAYPSASQSGAQAQRARRFRERPSSSVAPGGS